MDILEEFEELLDRVINEYSKPESDRILKDMIERINEVLES